MLRKINDTPQVSMQIPIQVQLIIQVMFTLSVCKNLAYAALLSSANT